MNSLKPIETLYKGYRFRSRLEARWAVFFDELGWTWLYEYQGYDLGKTLGYYLPDFYLSNFETPAYVEIKPTVPTKLELQKCLALASAGYYVYCFWGLPSGGTSDQGWCGIALDDTDTLRKALGFIQRNDTCWIGSCANDKCRASDTIFPSKKATHTCPTCGKKVLCYDQCNEYIHAANAARSARFEDPHRGMAQVWRSR